MNGRYNLLQKKKKGFSLIIIKMGISLKQGLSN